MSNYTPKTILWMIVNTPASEIHNLSKNEEKRQAIQDEKSNNLFIEILKKCSEYKDGYNTCNFLYEFHDCTVSESRDFFLKPGVLEIILVHTPAKVIHEIVNIIGISNALEKPGNEQLFVQYLQKCDEYENGKHMDSFYSEFNNCFLGKIISIAIDGLYDISQRPELQEMAKDKQNCLDFPLV